MVLINEKKYACATCIKGHRVSSCTHTERPLFEVKKKGRPQTQCTHCRERRKGGQAHVKCQCEAASGSKAMPDPIPVTQTTAPNPAVLPVESSCQQTRKGQPGSQATFPNGLKDVHEMAAAADALAGLTGEAATSQERKITSLLNPCHCATTGICRCCGPPSKRGHRPDSQSTPSSETASLSGVVTPVSTDQLLADMLKTKATTGSSSPMSNVGNWLSCSTSQGHTSQSSIHHPTHTNPHVHKTKLYSPYTTPLSARKHASQSTEARSCSRPASRSSQHAIKPLANIDTLLTAIFTPDGQAAKSIPRAALGLPGINTLLSPPEGSQPATPRPEDVDMLVDFPTQEPVDLAACTCGDDCECPGCAVHGNENDDPGTPTMAKAGGCCGEGCTSKYDCAKHLSLPSGITSIEHLISLAAANVPAPPDRSRGFGIKLEPNDLGVFPSAHQTALDEEAARSMGVVQLKPLECCNGRCQCPPGDCTCMQDCCGCCARCLCEDETAPSMASRSTEPVPPANSAPASTASSCCSAPPQTTDVPPASSVPVLSPIPQRVFVASPVTAGEPSAGSCCKATATGPSALRRSSSGLRMTQASSRRTSVSTPQGALQRSASTGKSASKALALHVQPNHPRLILPRPQNVAAKLSASVATPSTSRSASPGRLSRVSSPSPSLTSSVSTQPAGPPSLPSTNTSPSRQDDPASQGTLPANNSADVNMTEADIFACLEQFDQGASYQSFATAEHPFKPNDIATIEALKQPPLNMLGPFDQPTSGHHPYPQTQPAPQYSAYTPPVPAQYYGLPPSSAPVPYSPYATAPWQAWQQRQYTAPPPPDQQQQQSPYCPPQPYSSSPDNLIAEVARLVSIGQLPPSVLSLNGGGQGSPLDLRQLLAIQSQNAPLVQNTQQFAPQVQQPLLSQQPLAQLQTPAQQHQQPLEQSTSANTFDAAAFDALFQQSMLSSQYAFTSPLESSRQTPGDQTLFGVAEDAFDFEAFLQSSGPV